MIPHKAFTGAALPTNRGLGDWWDREMQPCGPPRRDDDGQGIEFVDGESRRLGKRAWIGKLEEKVEW
jgi:hypothetical protein